MTTALLTFVFGIASGLVLNRTSHQYGRQLDARAGLVGAFRRAQEYLVDYRHAGLSTDIDVAQSDEALGRVRAALIEFDVHAAALDMLDGPQELTAARHELTDCMDRIAGLVRHFADSEEAERLAAFEETEVAGEIDMRLMRVLRRHDIIVARYRRFQLASALRTRRSRKRAAEAELALGSPPRHGYRVDRPEMTPL